mmetsp:Transcript_1734/g.3837  ORF Transcript_1734/g.3837 Transcript_1734/m.3837 type:complete len:192 (+) Transcript_1734:652-1227(+)
MIENPNESIPKYLDRVRTRESASSLVDGPALRPDSGNPGSTLRRTGVNFQKGTKFKQGGGKQQGFNKWRIPPIPDTWIKLMKPGTFNMIKSWRSTANGTTTSPAKLCHDFNINYDKPVGGSGNGGNKKRKQFARRGQRQETEGEISLENPEDDQAEDAEADNGEVRVYLNSTRLNRRTGKQQKVLVTQMKM